MTQYARPDSDISLTNWTGSYTDIDESSPSDADYIVGSNGSNGTAQFGLSNVTDPTSSSDHTIKFRARKNSSGGNDRQVTAYLYDGASQIASLGSGDLTDSWTDYSYTLNSTEADNISDYTDLRIWFTSAGDTSMPAPNRRYVWVSWADFEVPDANVIVNLDSLSITSNADNLSVVAGEVITVLDALTITSNAETLSVVISANIIVNLDTLTITSSPESLTIVPGAISVSIDTLTIVSNTENLSVIPGEASISLDTLSITSTVETITIVPGVIAINLDTLTIVSNAETLLVVVSASVVILDTLSLASGAETLTIMPGEASIGLDTLTLVSSVESLSVFIQVLVLLNTLTLSSNIETLSVSPGSVSPDLDTLTLASSVLNLTVGTTYTTDKVLYILFRDTRVYGSN